MWGTGQIWVFYTGRTCPAIVHGYNASSEPNAIEIHLMRRPDVDGVSPAQVETKCLTGSGDTSPVVHVPPDWQTADWTLSRVPHGIFYVFEMEYSDAGFVLRGAEMKRAAALAIDNPPTQPPTSIPPPDAAQGNQGDTAPENPEPPQSSPQEESRQIDITNKSERKAAGGSLWITRAQVEAWNNSHPDRLITF